MSIKPLPLSWTGTPSRELMRLAWPIAVSSLSYSVMTVVDTLFVGQLGASALAGVSLGGVATFTLVVFGFGLLRAVKIKVSHAVGAGRRHESRGWLDAGVICGLGLGLAMAALGPALGSGLRALLESATAARSADTYVTIRLLSAPVMMLFVAIREHRYGIGDSRSPMVATLLANGVNIGLDAILIFGLGWGVAGAAWASVAAVAVEASLVLGVELASGWRPRLPTLPRLAGIWDVGLPNGLQFLLEVGSFAMLSVIIAGFGDAQLAAHQITLQLCHVAFLPNVALAEAAGVLTGQAVGAGQLPLVQRVARRAAVMSVAYTVLCSLAMLLLGHRLAVPFTPDVEVQNIAASLMLAAGMFLVADGVGIVARGALRGTGDVRTPAVVGTLFSWALTPPLAYLLGREAGMGALGGWIGLSAEIVVSGAYFWWRLEAGGWHREARRATEALAADTRPSLVPA
ncbi:MAG: MATE family efflux transporter [Sandaracinaceae bacterium]